MVEDEKKSVICHPCAIFWGGVPFFDAGYLVHFSLALPLILITTTFIPTPKGRRWWVVRLGVVEDEFSEENVEQKVFGGPVKLLWETRGQEICESRSRSRRFLNWRFGRGQQP